MTKSKKNKASNTKNQKQETVEKQQTFQEAIATENEAKKLLKIILIITIIMLIFYGITIIATQKADEVKSETTTEEETETADIQYENIIIGTMLNYTGTYYVLIEAEDDERVTEYESLMSTIESSDDAPTFYKANLTDDFNKQYLAKEENYYPTDISEFAVTGTTLVKIIDGKIDSVYDNYDAIKNKLNDIV